MNPYLRTLRFQKSHSYWRAATLMLVILLFPVAAQGQLFGKKQKALAVPMADSIIEQNVIYRLVEIRGWQEDKDREKVPIKSPFQRSLKNEYGQLDVSIDFPTELKFQIERRQEFRTKNPKSGKNQVMINSAIPIGLVEEAAFIAKLQGVAQFEADFDDLVNKKKSPAKQLDLKAWFKFDSSADSARESKIEESANGRKESRTVAREDQLKQFGSGLTAEIDQWLQTFPDHALFEKRVKGGAPIRGSINGELRIPKNAGMFKTKRGDTSTDERPVQSFEIEWGSDCGAGPGIGLTFVYAREIGPPQPTLLLSAHDANPMYWKGNLPPSMTLEEMPTKLSAKQLLAIDQPRKGATCDGISALIIRADLNTAASVEFKSKEGIGKLIKLLDGKTVENGPGKFAAFALYVPPADFAEVVRHKKPKAVLDPAVQPKQRLDGVIECDDLLISAVVGGNEANAPKLTLKLARAPVVMVHGLFSNPVDCWIRTKDDGTSLVVLLERAGILPFLVNYEATNGSSSEQKSSFRDNYSAVWSSPSDLAGAAIEYGWLNAEHRRGWLQDEEEPILSEFQKPTMVKIGGIKQALDYYRTTLQISATSADVIGHSMGGLLARAYASEKYNATYRRPENFQQGDIRRLITICTPHHGSELPDLKDVLQTAEIDGEKWTAWSRRCLYRSALTWFLEPEPGAITDLRPGSAALRDLGATSIPSFAIATKANDSQAARDDFDPNGMYQHFYGGLGMVFFFNPALLDEFVARRAREWEGSGELRRDTDSAGNRGFDWESVEAQAKFQDAFRAGLEKNVYYWVQRREGAYRDNLEKILQKNRIVPYGMVDDDDQESWLGDINADISQAVLGGDLTALRKVNKEPDIPYEFISQLRMLVFNNDMQSDGAVRVASQKGSLENCEVIDGVLHSFAPWNYKVQRLVIDLLKWEGDRFATDGFAAAGQILPNYCPTSTFHEDRIDGDAAIAWSGMVPSHAQTILKVADESDVILIYRPVNRDCTSLIAAHNATKGMKVKGKSADWGPQMGYIPRSQRFSKLWTQFANNPELRAKKIADFNKITEEVLAEERYPDDPENPELKGRPFAVPRGLEVDIAGTTYVVLEDPEQSDAGLAIFLKAANSPTYFDWKNGAAKGDDATGHFDRTIAPIALDPQPNAATVARMKPLEVLADGLTTITPPPFLTADYDLLAIAERDSSDFHGTPKEVAQLKKGKPDPLRGYISRQQWQLVRSINEAVREQAGYRGGNVTHHGPENQYPASPYVDYPLLVFDPGTAKSGDGMVFVIRQGPPGFRDLHLKRYYSEKIGEKFNLFPNPDGNGWLWERWRKFTPGRGYDPRDAENLALYVEEAAPPDKHNPPMTSSGRSPANKR
jgi:pimeloyl-ACP methyl ester carboxylesterase